ncbi:MAG TPA: hypothetical protein VEB21_13980, partial [Terriglobales bacterium]|nr:hypothetical protein [Terriglobales bacterium]
LPGTCAGEPTRNCSTTEPCGAGDTCRAPALIRSSPAISDNGSILIGSDDGFLYVIGRIPAGAVSPVPTETPAPSQTATSGVATSTPTLALSPTEGAMETPTELPTAAATETAVPIS